MADPVIRMAAVMFTDQVASTELRLRVGEEVADEIRSRHDSMLADAVAAHDGKIVKRR